MWIKTKSLFRNSLATASYCSIAFPRQTLAPSAVASRNESRNGFESWITVSKDLASGFTSSTFSRCWPKNQPKASASKLSFKAQVRIRGRFWAPNISSS
ncbi:uncharacterized protein LY89DRAFT_410719 [Mollisia scopiformis]|uniref:Uncharacterized protein n=1 Tax=Mollisia scopiformis TaxID=149040 RepID=A0A132B3A3_MOLSC|nr:uncharacterized protein LY89DRAFT_410719 [Mollisia scopiformis]KUJ06519.1 hypothetical protein LY89DRAFT_410719 [Mollisia scopiformis]